MDPVVKWAGGKRRMLQHILPLVPDDVPIVEPFAGGAALSLALGRPSILMDACAPLINTYRVIAEPGGCVYLEEKLRAFEQRHGEAFYYQLRDAFNEKLQAKVPGISYLQAARFLYINKAGFNGLWRVNASGACNVPWGKRKKVTWDYENLLKVHRWLRRHVKLACDVMPDSMRWIPKDPPHFWYLDPPYFNTFSNHTAKGFIEDDHRLLAAQLSTISAAGHQWLLSHADDPLYRELYPEDRFERIEVQVRRSISAKAKSRGFTGELLIRPKQ